MSLTRRKFFQVLAASALAAGVPLPIGFPREIKPFVCEWTEYVMGFTRMADAKALQQSDEDMALMLCDLRANRNNRLKSDHASTSNKQRV